MANPAKVKLKEDILNILRNSDEMLRKFRRQIENKHVIIFVGSTRNGKSTLVNFVTGAPLVAFQEGGMFKIEHQNGTNVGPTIAHGTLSHTTIPIVIQMVGKTDTVIVDAPGFDDNRGAAQEIINALYINQIKYSKGVRFVLVSDINNIINDNINSFLSFIETVHTIMPDFLKLKEAVSIIFTKDSRQYNQAEIIRLLQTKILDEDGLRCKKDLIRHFVQREDLIGLFKRPTAAGALTEEINVNVHGAIFRSLPINLNEADIKFGMSKSARVILLETYLEFFDVVISLKDTFRDFRISALDKFCSLKGDKLFPLSDEQLSSGDRNAKQILEEFRERIEFAEKQVISTMQIPDGLKQLFVEDVNRFSGLLQSIGVQVPADSEPRLNLNIIEEVQEKLEYITCIEKVVEKDNKSKNILSCYQKNTGFFYKQIKDLHHNVDNEVNTRDLLTFQASSIPSIKDRLCEVDETYLFASTENELINMKRELEQYISATDQVLQKISQRPTLQRSLQYISVTENSFVRRDIDDKIGVIQRLVESRKQECFSKNIPPPIPGIVGSLMLCAGIRFFGTLSHLNQLKVAAGSFLMFAAFSWRSVYMRTLFSRIRRRHQQRRLFTSRTKLDACWKVLVHDPYLKYRYSQQ